MIDPVCEIAEVEIDTTHIACAGCAERDGCHYADEEPFVCEDCGLDWPLCRGHGESERCDICWFDAEVETGHAEGIGVPHVPIEGIGV